MEVNIALVFLFQLILLLVKDGKSSPMTNGGGALRRYRKVRDLILFPISSSRERRRRNQSTYTLIGRRYFVKKERQCSHDTITTAARRDSSPVNGNKDDARGSNSLSKNKQKPLFLDASKRQAFREYHRLGLHLR